MTNGDIAAWIGIIISLIAVLGLIVELRSSRLALQTQTLMDLETRFYAEEMKAVRRTAARKLLAGAAYNAELEDTLDFLHDVVMLVERKVIDRRLAFEFYKYWIARYWLVAEPHIARARVTDDPDSYMKVEYFARQVIARSPDTNYSPEALRIFLIKEAGLDEPPGEL